MSPARGLRPRPAPPPVTWPPTSARLIRWDRIGSDDGRLVDRAVANKATRRVHDRPVTPVGARSLRLVRPARRQRPTRDARRPPTRRRRPGAARRFVPDRAVRRSSATGPPLSTPTILVGSGAGCVPTSRGTGCTCSPGRRKPASGLCSYMIFARTPKTSSRSCSTTGPACTGVMPSKRRWASSAGWPPQHGRATDYDVSTLSGRRVRGSTTPDGLVALLTFLAEIQPTRSSHGAAWPLHPPLSGGAW